MGLARCRECEREVSDQAPFCPQCGAPRPTIRDWKGTGIDWKTNATIAGYPLVHVAFGRDSRGRLRVAKGFVAVGQFGVGVIVFAQFGVAILFGFGQFIFGLTALAQFAIGIALGIGQFATGALAVGQFAVGLYALGQVGFGKYVWSPSRVDMEAVALFHTIVERLLRLIGINP